MTVSRFEHKLSVLSANLRCLTVPIPASRSITLLVLVKVGSRYETKKENGISHFMEHMFFKGAKKYPNTMAVAGAIEGAGGAFNAFTGEEAVGYYVKISSSKKEVAYDVLSDMLLHSKFDQEEVERERGVIVEEIRMYHDDPMSQVHLDFQSLAFGDQPLGWDIAGPEGNILKINSKDFFNYHDRHYHGANCVVTCAGDITPAEHEELCGKYFTFTKEAEKKSPPSYQTIESDRVYIRNKETEQAHFIFGFYACQAEHSDMPALKVLNNILGGNMSSRLFYQIRERRGLAYYIHSGISSYSDVGLFEVSGGVNLSKVKEAVSCAIVEIEKIKSEKVTNKELTSAKENMIGLTDLAFEDSRRVASFYGMRETLYGKIKTVEEIGKEIEAVTVDDILTVAKKYFLDEQMKLSVIGPFKEKEKVKFETVFKLG